MNTTVQLAKHLVILIGAAAALLLPLSGSALAAPYRIGVPLPLTGELAAYGQDIQHSLIVAREMLEADDVQLIFEDDRCEAARSVTVAQKLVELDRVAAVTGIFCNPALAAAAPIYNRAGVPVLTVGATTGDQRSIGPKIFRLYPADQMSVPPLLRVIAGSGKHLCVLNEEDPFTGLIERTMSREARAYGVSLAEESVEREGLDFRSALLRLKKRGCDSLFLNTVGDESFTAAFKQTAELKLGLPIFALYSPGSKAVRGPLGKSLEGVVYADLPSRDAAAAAQGQKFIERFRVRFGNFQVAQPVGLFAFEALRLILAARAAGAPLDQFLRGAKRITDGALRPYSFDSDGALQGFEFRILRCGASEDREIDVPQR